MSDKISTHTMRVALDVARARHHQVAVEGWTPQHDDNHDAGELARAAAVYALCAAGDAQDRDVMEAHGYDGVGSIISKIWPAEWDTAWLKPKTRRLDLVRAAALIMADIERIDRAEGRGLGIEGDELALALAEIVSGFGMIKEKSPAERQQYERLDAKSGDVTTTFRLDLLQRCILFAHDLEALEPIGRSLTLRAAVAEMMGTAAFLIWSVNRKDGEPWSAGRFAFAAWVNAATQVQQIAALAQGGEVAAGAYTNGDGAREATVPGHNDAVKVD